MAVTDQPALADNDRLPLRLAGFLAIALGVIALMAPFYAGIAATLVLGVNFLLGGILEAIASFRAQRWTGMLGLILLAIVSVIAGIYILAHPILGLVTITIVSIAAIFAAGIAKLVWAINMTNGNRWMVVLSGLLSLAVAAMLYYSFPFSAPWAFGVLVGVNLIAEGAALLAYANRTA